MGGFMDSFGVPAIRARGYAYLNFITLTLEMGLYLRSFMVNRLALDGCLHQSCDCLLVFFVFRGAPLVFSLLLLFGVTTRHVISCNIWYWSEFIGIVIHVTIYFWLFWHGIHTAGHAMFHCVHLAVRLAGMYLIYDFMYNLYTTDVAFYIKGNRSTIAKIMDATTAKEATMVSIHNGSGLNITLKTLKSPKVLYAEEEKVALPETTSPPPPEYSECVVPIE